MHWLPWPVLPRLKWLPWSNKERRAITADEHHRIIAREHNPEIRAYYQLLWHLGGSQTDIADLTAQDIDWKDRTVSYQRRKTGVRSLSLSARRLPASWSRFPSLARCSRAWRESRRTTVPKCLSNASRQWRSPAFPCTATATLGRNGPRRSGCRKRFAQQALGHSSKAFVRGLFQEGQGGCSFVGGLRGENRSDATRVNQ